MNKAAQFRELLHSPRLEFLCEAHNGLSAKIAEEAGFKGLWGSSLTMSAALGVRDNNEASWTQILEILEFMSDCTSIPILLDADTGYGNFNNVRRLVKKLEQRHIAAICIEDKLFPKTNSLLEGGRQQLAEIDEFCGKIKAAKDIQTDPNFSVIARIEAFIAGWGLKEALRRAEAYHKAGADGILIHSKSSKADEVLAFKKEWGNRSPVIIVPTKYYTTPTDIFHEAGFSMVIWANMMLRGALKEMRATAEHLAREQSLLTLEDRIAPIDEVFKFQGAYELASAEDIYLPKSKEETSAVILAASQGKELGELTEKKPKALLEVAGKPILYKQVETLNAIGIKNITVVRGFHKELISDPDMSFADNNDYASSQEAVSLLKGLQNVSGKTLIAYGDILYKKYIPLSLLEMDGDINIAVDIEWEGSFQRGRYTDFVKCDQKYQRKMLDQKIQLIEMSSLLPKESILGEWIGLVVVSAKGLLILKNALQELSQRDNFKQMRMADLFSDLLRRGNKIGVLFVHGNWLDIDDIKDLNQASSF